MSIAEPTTDDTEEEQPKPMQDLENVDTALGALEEDGTDADADDLEPVIELAEELIEAADGRDELQTPPGQALIEGRDALEYIADGEGTEEDVESAQKMLSALGESISASIVKMALGVGGKL